MIEGEPKRESLADALVTLRKEIHEKMRKELTERLKENPIPSEDEIYITVFREMLEPQVRDAVFVFRRKGYTPESSGFTGDAKEQLLDGYFTLDDETVKKIEAFGATVTMEKLYGEKSGIIGTMISFKPKTDRLESMKAAWDHIASLLPDRGEPGPPSINGEPEQFEDQYAPHRPDIARARIKRALALFRDYTDPAIVRKQEERLQQLENTVVQR